MNALLLLFGAYSVINGDLTVGALVAFNMISGQAIQPAVHARPTSIARVIRRFIVTP